MRRRWGAGGFAAAGDDFERWRDDGYIRMFLDCDK